MENDKMRQFVRIARARLRGVFSNKAQRNAWAAKMWVRYINRKGL